MAAADDKWRPSDWKVRKKGKRNVCKANPHLLGSSRFNPAAASYVRNDLE